MAKIYGSFNIVTNQFLDDSLESYLMRDQDRIISVWGELNTDTGEFIATRNPIRYKKKALTYNPANGLPKNEQEREIFQSEVEIDNSIDYVGAKFVDTAFLKAYGDRHIVDKEIVDYAIALSAEAKKAILGNGDVEAYQKRKFAALPQKVE